MRNIIKTCLTILILSSEILLGNSEKQNVKTTNSDLKSNRNLSQQELGKQQLSKPEADASNEPMPVVNGITELHSHVGPLNLRLKRDMYTDDQMELLYKFFIDKDWLREDSTISEPGFVALAAKSHSLIYDDMLKHRYDSYTELMQSYGPHIDQELCMKHLENLNERINSLEEKKFNSADFNLYRLLDSYGRVSPGLMTGSLFWPGMHEDCLNMMIESPEGEVPTRYCLAFIRNKKWPQDSQFNKMLAYKVGICLPKACNSLKYKNKYQLIKRLMDFNTRDVDDNQSYLVDLYCLPDKDSPMRMWWKSPRTLQAVVVFSVWISILIFATIKYECLKKMAPSESSEVGNEKLSEGSDAPKFGLTGGFQLESKEKKVEPPNDEFPSFNFKIYKMLAITNNFKSLFDTTTRKSIEISTTSKDRSLTEAEKLQLEAKLKPVVNLRCLEGIKVICMSYVIMGHVLMCITSVMSNGRELASTSSPAWIIANMMPAFAVNAFFTITGLLTCYLLMKQNESYSFMTSPFKWATLIVYRYLRIMPMYMVVVYFCKYISKYTGSGPMWDYGTSSLANRRRCEEEPWLWTILFTANFKPIFDQCIPSAWYLANDFQFFMITPMFLAALYKRPVLGKRLLSLCIVAGYLAGMVSVISVNMDMRPIAKFMPHGFKTYVTFLSAAYSRPQYRIPAYLCGLLFGYQLHIYEQDKLKHRIVKEGKDETLNQKRRELDWPSWFLRFGSILSLFCIMMCAVIPILASLMPLNKTGAQWMTAFVMSSYHIMFAFGVGLYILLATTGNGNKLLNNFLSASFWKPLSRLSLCAVLINIEVINYIIQTREQQIYIDFFAHSSLNLLGLATTYLTATVVFVLFEAPIKASSNQLVTYLLQRLVSKQKED